VIEVRQRSKTQAPPPWKVFEALVDPDHGARWQWLALASDEVALRIVEASRPSLVVWSSIFSDRPDNLIRYEIESDGGAGTRLTWILLATEPETDRFMSQQMRYRLNLLINGNLREVFD
jgi:uncharacterized protein YndB with AHSA1/START domain